MKRKWKWDLPNLMLLGLAIAGPFWYCVLPYLVIAFTGE